MKECVYNGIRHTLLREFIFKGVKKAEILNPKNNCQFVVDHSLIVIS